MQGVLCSDLWGSIKKITSGLVDFSMTLTNIQKFAFIASYIAQTNALRTEVKIGHTDTKVIKICLSNVLKYLGVYKGLSRLKFSLKLVCINQWRSYWFDLNLCGYFISIKGRALGKE